jgi:hypothetical protein
MTALELADIPTIPTVARIKEMTILEFGGSCCDIHVAETYSSSYVQACGIQSTTWTGLCLEVSWIVQVLSEPIPF